MSIHNRKGGKRNRLRMEIAQAQTEAKMALDKVTALRRSEIRMLEESALAIIAELNRLAGTKTQKGHGTYRLSNGYHTIRS